MLDNLRLHKDESFAGITRLPGGGEIVAFVSTSKKCEYDEAGVIRRVAACWNACIGIPTEVLEATDPDERPALMNALAKEVARLRGELKVLQQREA